VIIECTNCHARYQYDEDRFERKPLKKIKCAKCSTVFEIHNPAYAPKAAGGSGDMTYTKREGPKPPAQDTTSEAEIPAGEPRSTGEVASNPQLPEGKRLSLAVINGADAGSVYRIEKPRVTVGRSGADVNLNDTEASRHHAAVEIRDTLYLLEDLQSTNGTLVDGQKISGQVELQNHSEFQIGSTTIMLIVTDDV
jgi:predicted Zn finger-like uncharacterized protein